LRLLVIEDEKSLLKIIAKRLKEEGYSVDAVTNGRGGENYIYQTAVILDSYLNIFNR
jgi:DNA-binding response OmpR family regulator